MITVPCEHGLLYEKADFSKIEIFDLRAADSSLVSSKTNNHNYLSFRSALSLLGVCFTYA